MANTPRRIWFRTAFGLLAVAAVVACGKDTRVEQVNTTRAPLLVDCPDWTRREATPERRAEFREMAARIARFENRRGDIDAAKHMLAAYGSGDFAVLEETVATYLCADSARAVLLSEPVFPDSGSVMPPFELMALGAPEGDAPVRLTDFHGRYVLLDYWATYCVPCVAKYPDMARLAREFSGRGIEVRGILYNQYPEVATRWFERHGGMGYPLLVDPGSVVAHSHQVIGLPRTFLVGPDGRLVWSCLGCGADTLRVLFNRLAR